MSSSVRTTDTTASDLSASERLAEIRARKREFYIKSAVRRGKWMRDVASRGDLQHRTEAIVDKYASYSKVSTTPLSPIRLDDENDDDPPGNNNRMSSPHTVRSDSSAATPIARGGVPSLAERLRRRQGFGQKRVPVPELGATDVRRTAGGNARQHYSPVAMPETKQTSMARKSFLPVASSKRVDPPEQFDASFEDETRDDFLAPQAIVIPDEDNTDNDDAKTFVSEMTEHTGAPGPTPRGSTGNKMSVSAIDTSRTPLRDGAHLAIDAPDPTAGISQLTSVCEDKEMVPAHVSRLVINRLPPMSPANTKGAASPRTPQNDVRSVGSMDDPVDVESSSFKASSPRSSVRAFPQSANTVKPDPSSDFDRPVVQMRNGLPYEQTDFHPDEETVDSWDFRPKRTSDIVSLGTVETTKTSHTSGNSQAVDTMQRRSDPAGVNPAPVFDVVETIDTTKPNFASSPKTSFAPGLDPSEHGRPVALKHVEPIEVMEPIELVEPIEVIEPMELINSVEPVELVERVEAVTTDTHPIELTGVDDLPVHLPQDEIDDCNHEASAEEALPLFLSQPESQGVSKEMQSSIQMESAQEENTFVRPSVEIPNNEKGGTQLGQLEPEEYDGYTEGPPTPRQGPPSPRHHAPINIFDRLKEKVGNDGSVIIDTTAMNESDVEQKGQSEKEDKSDVTGEESLLDMPPETGDESLLDGHDGQDGHSQPAEKNDSSGTISPTLIGEQLVDFAQAEAAEVAVQMNEDKREFKVESKQVENQPISSNQLREETQQRSQDQHQAQPKKAEPKAQEDAPQKQQNNRPNSNHRSKILRRLGQEKEEKQQQQKQQHQTAQTQSGSSATTTASTISTGVQPPSPSHRTRQLPPIPPAQKSTPKKKKQQKHHQNTYIDKNPERQLVEKNQEVKKLEQPVDQQLQEQQEQQQESRNDTSSSETAPESFFTSSYAYLQSMMNFSVSDREVDGMLGVLDKDLNQTSRNVPDQKDDLLIFLGEELEKSACGLDRNAIVENTIIPIPNKHLLAYAQEHQSMRVSIAEESDVPTNQCLPVHPRLFRNSGRGPSCS